MFGIGYLELMVILVIVLVLFGGSKLPDLAKSLGKSMKEFKKGIGAEPEAEQTPKPQPVAAAIPAPPQTCGYCKNPLEADWAHCPRCGTPVAPGPTPTVPK
ncbi:MAG TPA: twin-arginine translocase TatA/TatE family subunit [Actinomycetota bacterium]|nr:twin-arginine translocase TatA/TatE family subunit [Actinomycetota bacterium]